MPELTWTSPSFPDQAKKGLIKHVLQYLRQTYNVLFNCTTQIRKTSMVQWRLIILLSILCDLHLPSTAKEGLEHTLQNGFPSPQHWQTSTKSQGWALHTSSRNVLLSDRPVAGPTNPWQTWSQCLTGSCWIICLRRMCRALLWEWLEGGSSTKAQM